MKLAKATLDYQHDGQVATVRLAAPKANILDQVMMANLCEIFQSIGRRMDLKTIVVTAEGPSFSYGASVQEHLPDQIAGTLKQLRELLELMIDAPAPTIAAVRGQCLGGGFELVLACDLILAEETAQFGCPEIRLGVFPPAASALLPVKVGSARAANLVLSGDSWTGTAASGAGLVSFLTGAGGLDQKLKEVLEADFLPRSAAALRYAAQAVRLQSLTAIKEVLPQLERMYLSELMKDLNALEGIRAFLEKRQPSWARSKPVN